MPSRWIFTGIERFESLQQPARVDPKQLTDRLEVKQTSRFAPARFEPPTDLREPPALDRIRTSSVSEVGPDGVLENRP